MLPSRRVGDTLWHLTTNLGLDMMTELLSIDEETLREISSTATVASPEQTQIILDLGFIYDSLTLDYLPGPAISWLRGHNAHLGGARPLDFILAGKLDEVYLALMASRAGAYA